MREILFRAKRIDNGEWENGTITHSERNISGEINECFICRGFANQADVVKIKVDPETVCQWTGLTDKNGVNIFEGDVVKYSQQANWDYKDTDWRFTGLVDFNNGSFGIVKKLEVGKDYWSTRSVKDRILVSESNSTWGLEVIGNIFDNPELLNQ